MYILYVYIHIICNVDPVYYMYVYIYIYIYATSKVLNMNFNCDLHNIWLGSGEIDYSSTMPDERADAELSRTTFLTKHSPHLTIRPFERPLNFT